MARVGWLLVGLGWWGCANPPQEPPPEPLPVSLSFSVPRDGVVPGNFELPYPNELWRRADGTLDLASFPGLDSFLAQNVKQLAEQDGAFALNGGIYAHFEGAFGALPSPAESLDPASPLFLVELRSDGSLGERVPLLVRANNEGSFLRPDRTLTLMPVFGATLRPNTSYAAVITSGLLAQDGTPATPSSDFAELRLPDPPQDGALLAADAQLEPLLVALEGASIARDEVVWASVFRSGDPVSPTFRVEDFVFAGGAGVPAPEFSQVPQFTGRLNDADVLEFRGQMLTPRFQAGTPPFLSPEAGGAILFDGEGNPIVQALDPVDVVITVPDAPVPLGGWPVVIYNHGTGGDADSFVGVGQATRPAAVLGREGFAVIGIDQPLHGAREIPGVDVNIATFNPLNLASTRDIARQSAADNVQLLRIIEAGISLDAEGVPVSLSQGPVFFMGHSQGSVSGPLFLSWAQQFGKIQAAVLSGAAGSLQLAIADRFLPLNGDFVEARSFLATFVGESPEEMDELHPLLSLAQQVIEAEDPLCYARLFHREAENPFDVLLTQGFLDIHTPPRNSDAMAVGLGVSIAARADGVVRDILGLEVAGFAPLAPPFSGNEGVTAAIAQFPRDDHFAVFDNTDAQSLYGHFLGTALRTGRAEVQVYGEQ